MRCFLRFEKPGAAPRFSNERPRRRAALATIACALLLSVAAGAQERPASVAAPEPIHYGWADVLRVDPVYDDAAVASDPQQECYEEQVLQEPAQASAPDDGKRVGATVIGALLGGIVGSRFGKGDGRKAATAAGAIAGGVVGNNIGSSNDPGRVPPRYTTQRRCRQVEGAPQRHVVAYDVEYRYRGELYTSRMNTDPGDRMRVKVTVMPAE